MKRELNLNYDSPYEIKTLLEIMGLGPRKRWGQNFLINSGARKKIVDLLDPGTDEKVWEIGPGLGAMTSIILDRGCDLTAFEIDPGYCEYLSMAFEGKSLRIVEGDVLKEWKTEWERNGRPDKILGNLPYNAASAIIGQLLESGKIPGKMVFLVQSEMGDRMKASPGCKNYSSFSVMCQYSCKIDDGGKLGSGSFYPAPRVSSSIVVMTPDINREKVDDRDLFSRLVRGLFSSRRKTIRNNIKRMSAAGFAGCSFETLESVFNDLNIDTTLRTERLSVDQFVSVCNAVSAIDKKNIG